MEMIKIILTTIRNEKFETTYRVEAYLEQICIMKYWGKISRNDALGEIILNLGNKILENGIQIELKEEWK